MNTITNIKQEIQSLLNSIGGTKAPVLGVLSTVDNSSAWLEFNNGKREFICMNTNILDLKECLIDTRNILIEVGLDTITKQ